MKYTLFICLLLVGYVCQQHFSLRQSEEKNHQLQLQNGILRQKQENLTKKLEFFNAKQEKANQQIAKLKALALQKSDDCYIRPLSDEYLEFVRGTKQTISK